MKESGYFLIKVKKTITLCLWSKNRQELEDFIKDEQDEEYEIVRSFNDENGSCYIEYDGAYIKV